MLAPLKSLDTLPRQNASQVKNRWKDVVRQVRQSGSVAITNHSVVEMVLVDAQQYRDLTEEIQAHQSREQAVLDELANRFDERLAVLQRPEARDHLQALFEAKGKLARAPKVGESY
ncbi:type II toxin-antitoxin system prevent-host-death family antitoxin [Bordetella sp. BOR01]|uniref:type II toxin-antitoxin system prevent-host-death family antitoxin n=1 Tax=Bordetella sp. BOR01 TaxID=2854779 RepID=UPI001C472A13|nr:type II toxin-antitoxin system prevent-host-death family antitoxin [Bordetella sp. BOR01]MBV7482100.1 type II toxin-antitoxin system prevent-host-death family antitoxin [Bordetella sp. BOR01]